MLVLDALVRPAFVLILHDTADELVILFQEPLDGLLIDFRTAPQPVGYEGHRHPGEPATSAVIGRARATFYALLGPRLQGSVRVARATRLRSRESKPGARVVAAVSVSTG